MSEYFHGLVAGVYSTDTKLEYWIVLFTKNSHAADSILRFGLTISAENFPNEFAL